MAESFLFNIAENILSKLTSAALQEISLAWQVNDDIRRLQDTLSTIKAVLLDAEEKQDKNRQLSLWLSQLKQACYDAEDIVEDFQGQALQRQATTGKLRRFFSRNNNYFLFRFKIAKKLRHVNNRFNEIASQKGQFHLSERLVDERVLYRRREMTHSFVNSADVIGREVDRDNIIEYLINYGDQESLFVVPIVGIGGLGKTTLAKMVYNDERVDRSFQLKMWVCVSEDFDVIRLTKEIANAATGRSCGDLTMDQLQVHLRRSLGERRVLLVLDDVWSKDRVKWVDLRDLIAAGCAIGSKVLVTTRNSAVASVMGDVPAYNLPGLPHKNCLTLFLKWAFSPGQEKQHPNLVGIGNEIVGKCGGVPLAVRTLGSLLYSSTNERDWLSIRDNEIWKLEQKPDDILPVLRLSYDHMPSYLKQCFAYCSLFPKDYVFNSFELVKFWMAYGLLESNNLEFENQGRHCILDRDMQDTGIRYVKELWSRSFFQDVEDHGFFFTCKMHDLIHDLALQVATTECSIIGSKTESVPKMVRHVSFSDAKFLVQEFPHSLRTIVFPVRGMGLDNEQFIDKWLSRFKYLRVLNLSDTSFEVLPSSIGSLIHMRYLDLYRNRQIRKLHDSICKLKNLQTLILEECEKLEEIPRGINNMSNLRFLEITTKQNSLPLNGIGSLSSLWYLSLFECSNLEHLFEDMDHLTSLRTLVISSCGSLTSLPKTIQKLNALETLVIGDCGKLNMSELKNNENLQMSLSSLVLGELPHLETLPEWLESCLSSLNYLYIDDCQNFKALPEWIKNLTSLRKLEILRCPQLMSLPEEMRHVTALKELKIGLCPDLTERCRPEFGDDWPKVAHVPEIFLNGIKVRSISE